MTLREIRFKRSLSQWHLSLKSTVPQSRISLGERGLVTFTEKEKEAIVSSLGLSTDDIEWPEIMGDRGCRSHSV